MSDKARSVAALNATPEQRALRSVGRIKTLKTAIEKATNRKQADRLASLQEELARRLEQIKVLKAALDEVDA